jgi:hypothetical protein
LEICPNTPLSAYNFGVADVLTPGGNNYKEGNGKMKKELEMNSIWFMTTFQVITRTTMGCIWCHT